MMTLADAIMASHEYRKEAMEADEAQSAPAPDATGKPTHDGEKPGIPTDMGKKEHANAIDPKGANNAKRMNKAEGMDNMSKAAEDFFAEARHRCMEKSAARISERQEAQYEAVAFEEELAKIASLDEDEFAEVWGPYALAGQQFAIGHIAGQAKIALEMEEAEGGGEPDVEEAKEILTEMAAEDIADSLEPEQLNDPSIQAEIVNQAEELAEETIEEMIEEASMEGQGMAAEGEGMAAEGDAGGAS